MYDNLVKTILNHYDGEIKPLILPEVMTGGTGICNPSILVDGDTIHVILRHVEYTLYICEGEQKYQSATQGPLSYYHREDKNELKTSNYYCTLNPETLELEQTTEIDTSYLDSDPKWLFVGLEDARLVKWLNKYYMCGVRRDTTTDGQGRIELSEIEITESSVKEVIRSRIEVDDKDSYCEKNWMPILSEPFHFVKWTDPTEIVEIDLETNHARRISHKAKKYTKPCIRGGSPLIKWSNNTYLCITHEVDFTLSNENGYKDASYYHRFVVFDENYDITLMTESFTFMTGKIEFCIGLDRYKEDILITFGFQDNGSYLIRIGNEKLERLIHDTLNPEPSEKGPEIVTYNKYSVMLLKKTKEFLDDQNIPFWLDCGTLLGAVREQNFIKHDNDIDFSVYKYDASIEFGKLSNYNLRIVNYYINYLHSQLLIIQLELDVDMELNDGIKTLDIYIQNYKPKLETIHFAGLEFCVPKNPELFLASLYGDWKVPNKNDVTDDISWETGFKGGEYAKYIEINED
tara:strand:- start:3857 stop:5407 length:1551 start_codon:yes stop_codon:yes gene_type:complete